MMSEYAIDIANLSKRYRLGQGHLSAHDSDALWALRDVSLRVEPGEVIGIIGKNGAGKSTLLKILSRITDPTEGRAVLRGRSASLLEVGTGFHPELTGRENVFVNAAILGMSRREIRRKFDGIVAFSGVEKFLDTPVKRYSSGMRVRLAFAVAAHLDPEIMIVDEVLAVGDAAFQKKCLGRMNEAAQNGRTVLFVSHNLHAVRSFCSRAIWLHDGRLMADGKCDDVIRRYTRDVPVAESLADVPGVLAKLPHDDAVRITDVRITQADRATDTVTNGEPVEIAIRYETPRPVDNLRIFFDLLDAHDNWLFRSFHDGDADEPSVVMPGLYESRVVMPADLLAAQTYTLRIGATIFGERRCTGDGVHLPLHVRPGGRVNRAYPWNYRWGGLAPLLDWRTNTTNTLQKSA